MKIVTFNLRCVYDNSAIDGNNTFINRKEGIARKILAEQPDVIGFQEATPPMIADLRVLLPDYAILLQLLYNYNVKKRKQFLLFALFIFDRIEFGTRGKIHQ